MKTYKYTIWGADVISDVQLNLPDEILGGHKRNLIKAKILVDRHNAVTTKIVIEDGWIHAYPDPMFKQNVINGERKLGNSECTGFCSSKFE